MVAVTDKYRQLVENRATHRRSVLFPMRVSMGGRTLFEGATLDVSGSGVYFRMPGGERLSAGDEVQVEMSVPAELAGGALGYHTWRQASVVRVEDHTLAHRVGCNPPTCGVALAFQHSNAAAASAARISKVAAAVA